MRERTHLHAAQLDKPKAQAPDALSVRDTYDAPDEALRHLDLIQLPQHVGPPRPPVNSSKQEQPASTDASRNVPHPVIETRRRRKTRRGCRRRPGLRTGPRRTGRVVNLDPPRHPLPKRHRKLRIMGFEERRRLVLAHKERKPKPFRAAGELVPDDRCALDPCPRDFEEGEQVGFDEIGIKA